METIQQDKIKQDKEIQIIQKETLTLKEKIDVLQITDESSEKLGATYLSFLAKAVKNLESARVRLTKPVLESKKNIDNEFKAMMEVPNNLIAELKKKLLSYNDVKRKQEQEKTDKVKQFAKDNGLPVPQSETVSAPQTQVRTAVGTTYIQKRWNWRLVDETKIPREYLMVDEKKINAQMRDHTKTIKDVTTMDLKIEGIEFFQDESIAVRT